MILEAAPAVTLRHIGGLAGEWQVTAGRTTAFEFPRIDARAPTVWKR